MDAITIIPKPGKQGLTLLEAMQELYNADYTSNIIHNRAPARRVHDSKRKLK